MRRMKSMCVSGIRGRPGPGLDFFRQYSLNFFFRHLMTVSGFTMTSREVQSCHTRERSPQNSRSRFLKEDLDVDRALEKPHATETMGSEDGPVAGTAEWRLN